MSSATNVKIGGVDGNLVYKTKSGQIIFTVDGANRRLQIPAGSNLDLVGQNINNVWYVAKVGTGGVAGKNAHDGKSWASPFLTITEALSVARDYDVVQVGLGVYDEGASLNITQKGLKLLGVMTSGAMWGQPSIKCAGGAESYDLINVKNDSVEIAGIGIHQLSANKGIVIAADAWGLNTWRTHIHDCFFGGNSIMTYGVWFGGVGTDAPFTIIEDCVFYNLAGGTCIYANGISVIRRNLIEVETAGVGIEFIPNGSSRPGTYIIQNKFRTTDSANAKGIKVTNTPSSGYLMIDDNRFIGFADAAHACDVCTSGKTGLMGLNYLAATAMAVS